MENFVIVGGISKFLKDLLFLKLNETFNTSFFIDNISLTSLKEIKDNTIGSGRLSLFLYGIVENAHVKNRPLENLGTRENKYPPLTLYNLIIRKCSLTSNPLFSMRFS